MTASDSQPTETASSRPTCRHCGHVPAADDRYCARCGITLGTNGGGADADALATRRRLGGTLWSPPPVADEGAAAAPPAPIPAGGARAQGKRKRRRRRRRPWFRRPLLVAPLALLLVAGAVAGVVAYRAESTIATLHSVSTPPPAVTDNTAGADPAQAALQFDSGPALAALQAAAAAERQGVNVTTGGGVTATADSGGTRGTSLPDPSTLFGTTGGNAGNAPGNGQSAGGVTPTARAHDDGGGLFGRVRDAASNVGDLAQGAAVAVGVKDPSQDTLNILVMGVDARPGAPIDVAVRPDALMVLHLNPATGSCRILAIPRDTRTNLPGYGLTKVNHALMVGGVKYQELVVERLLGLKLDRFALIDFAGFQAMVDAVGGVPITVPQDITSGAGVPFKAGPQTIDGTQALAYARYRGGADVDIGRVRRQQQIIRGLLQVAHGRDAVRDVNDLLPALKGHIRTDLSTSELVALANQYRSTCTEQALAMDSLQGNFVQGTTPDPLFKQPLTYNVVAEATIREKVAELTRS